MARRAGRPRKMGKRYPCGQIKSQVKNISGTKELLLKKRILSDLNTIEADEQKIAQLIEKPIGLLRLSGHITETEYNAGIVWSSIRYKLYGSPHLKSSMIAPDRVYFRNKKNTISHMLHNSLESPYMSEGKIRFLKRLHFEILSAFENDSQMTKQEMESLCIYHELEPWLCEFVKIRTKNEQNSHNIKLPFLIEKKINRIKKGLQIIIMILKL